MGEVTPCDERNKCRAVERSNRTSTVGLSNKAVQWEEVTWAGGGRDFLDRGKIRTECWFLIVLVACYIFTSHQLSGLVWKWHKRENKQNKISFFFYGGRGMRLHHMTVGTTFPAKTPLIYLEEGLVSPHFTLSLPSFYTVLFWGSIETFLMFTKILWLVWG